MKEGGEGTCRCGCGGAGDRYIHRRNKKAVDRNEDWKGGKRSNGGGGKRLKYEGEKQEEGEERE